jgi:hypothetical protein
MKAIMDEHQIAFEGFHEPLGHAVGFGVAHGCRARHQAQGVGHRHSLAGILRRATVREPLNGARQTIDPAKAGLHRFDHQAPDHRYPDPAGGANMIDHFPVAAVQVKGGPRHLAVPAGNLEHVNFDSLDPGSISRSTRHMPIAYLCIRLRLNN